MLSKLRPRSVYDVMAAIGCFAALATGSAYAANTVFSADIVDGEVKSVDIGNSEIGSVDVKDNSLNTFDVHSFLGVDIVDGSLEDQDIGQGTFVDFIADIGIVGDNSCEIRVITGINAAGDHMLLTPDWITADRDLHYEIQYIKDGDGRATLKVCNPTDFNIQDAFTNFNLLVIDAQ